MKKVYLIICLFFLAGCAANQPTVLTEPPPAPETEKENLSMQITEDLEASVESSTMPIQQVREPEESLALPPSTPKFVYPMQGYASRVTFKRFGQAVNDRFCCFHVADDLEVSTEEYDIEIPVYAVADGTVAAVRRASGYGGVIVLQHEINGKIVQSLYGHVDLSQTTIKPGDSVSAGMIISYLGDHESSETDGERKHLHFSVYEGSNVKLAGYVQRRDQISGWINPTEFLANLSASEPAA